MQPANEVAAALTQLVKRMQQRQNQQPTPANHTPGRNLKHVQEENMFESSAIRYCLTETTPFFRKRKSRLNTHKSVVTLVRRSTRRSHASLPRMLQEHDVVVENLDDLSPTSKQSALYIPNIALEVQFEEAADE